MTVVTAALVAAAAALVLWPTPSATRMRDLLPAGEPRRRPDRRRIVAVVLTVVAVFAWPPLVAAIALWWWGAPIVHRRRQATAERSAATSALPDLAELLLLATTAGLTVPLAIPLVARRVDGPIAAALAGVEARARRGALWADALAILPDGLGEGARPLVHALVDHERYGSPLAPALERAAAELRLDRRRAAERAARRVPVQLLFPLVLCTLPAFALLTVVPLLAGSLRGLRL